ncbi:hypothetical protein N9A86_02360 [Akkermansiaceae bacterium]|nr:hypothetical protein [Akkermansiaceae bacterium]MDB4537466.1 hypothetical protein [Akkermansiaceae bacterium]
MSDDSKRASVLHLVDSLLKSPGKLIAQIRDGKESPGMVAKFLLLSLLGLGLFGFVLGSFSWGEQLWWAPLKVVVGLGLSGLVCLPGFYVYAALSGASVSIREGTRFLMAAMGLMSILLVGFVPVLWVFSRSSDTESFFGFLALVIWLVSFSFGARFLFRVLGIAGGTKKAPLAIWLGMFLLVTLQLSTTLRPLIGTSEKVFTSEKRSFLVHWAFEVFEIKVSRHRVLSDPPRRTAPGVESENPYLEEE